MPRLYFSGLVLPERAQVHVNNLGMHIQQANNRPPITIALNIVLNQITAVVDTDETDIYTVRNFVRANAELITDVAGFLQGLSYDIEIVKAFAENLEHTQVFGVDIPVLADRATGRDINSLMIAILPLCSGPGSEFLRRSLSDLSFAMKRPDDTAFYCFRSIESLRHSFGAELPEDQQWLAMAKAVDSNKSDIADLRSYAFPARHGAHRYVTDADRQRFFLYTWSIVERYIDFRLVERNRPAVFASSA